MGYTKPKPLREIGFNTEAMNLAANSDVVITLDRWAKERVARRDFSVFDQLATNGKTVGTVVYKPTLSKAMAVAGNNMFAVYAAWKGLAGASEKPAEFIQCGRSEPELLTDRMRIAGDEWRAILSHMKPGNASLLAAICHDMLHANGAMLFTERSPEIEYQDVPVTRRAEPYEWGDPDGTVTTTVERARQAPSRPVVRWRRVVQTVCGINDRDCQRDAIKRMCDDLIKSLEKRPLSIIAY